MTRQSISFTSPNDEWLKAQVNSQEYGSKSEVINDLIRRARAEEETKELIRAKLIRSEQSGFVDKTPAEMLAGFKENLTS